MKGAILRRHNAFRSKLSTCFGLLTSHFARTRKTGQLNVIHSFFVGHLIGPRRAPFMVCSRRILIHIECVMNITELHYRAARLEAELRETRELLARATHDPGALAEELAQTRAYAFSANADPMETAMSGCADSLRRYGYCVIDNVIPGEEVETIRDEIVAADVRIKGNINSSILLDDLAKQD